MQDICTEIERQRWLQAVLATLRIELSAFYGMKTHITCMCDHTHTHTVQYRAGEMLGYVCVCVFIPGPNCLQ